MRKWLRYFLLCRRWYCKLVRRSNPLSSAQPDITSNTSTKWQEQPNLKLHIFLVWWIRKREKAGWWCSDKRKLTFSSSQTWLPEVSIFHCFKTSSILIFPLVWSCLFIDQVEQQEQAKKVPRTLLLRPMNLPIFMILPHMLVKSSPTAQNWLMQVKIIPTKNS